MNSLLKAINGVVLSRQSEYIDICIHGEVYKNTTWGGKFRVDSQVNEVAYQRMFAALDSFVSPLLSTTSSDSSSSSTSSSGSSASKHSKKQQSKVAVALRNLLLYTYPHSILNNTAASTEQRDTPSLPIHSIDSSGSSGGTNCTNRDTQKEDTIQPGMLLLLYTTTILT